MARSIQDGTNVDAPTADYPSGKTRDKAGSTPGTVPNEAINGDAQQFFARLMRDAVPFVAYNGLPDNETNGYQLFTAFTSYTRNVLTSTETAKGTVEKATPAESKSGTTDKNITADLIQSESALKASSSVAIAGTVSDQFMTPTSAAARDGGILRKKIDIGDWNMDANETAVVAHGVTFANIVGCTVLIRNDSNTERLALYGFRDVPATPTGEGGQVKIEASDITLYRRNGGEFDTPDYNQTSYNRGYIIIDYLQ